MTETYWQKLYPDLDHNIHRLDEPNHFSRCDVCLEVRSLDQKRRQASARSEALKVCRDIGNSQLGSATSIGLRTYQGFRVPHSPSRVAFQLPGMPLPVSTGTVPPPNYSPKNFLVSALERKRNRGEFEKAQSFVEPAEDKDKDMRSIPASSQQSSGIIPSSTHQPQSEGTNQSGFAASLQQPQGVVNTTFASRPQSEETGQPGSAASQQLQGVANTLTSQLQSEHIDQSGLIVTASQQLQGIANTTLNTPQPESEHISLSGPAASSQQPQLARDKPPTSRPLFQSSLAAARKKRQASNSRPHQRLSKTLELTSQYQPRLHRARELGPHYRPEDYQDQRFVLGRRDPSKRPLFEAPAPATRHVDTGAQDQHLPQNQVPAQTRAGMIYNGVVNAVYLAWRVTTSCVQGVTQRFHRFRDGRRDFVAIEHRQDAPPVPLPPPPPKRRRLERGDAGDDRDAGFAPIPSSSQSNGQKRKHSVANLHSSLNEFSQHKAARTALRHTDPHTQALLKAKTLQKNASAPNSDETEEITLAIDRGSSGSSVVEDEVAYKRRPKQALRDFWSNEPSVCGLERQRMLPSDFKLSELSAQRHERDRIIMEREKKRGEAIYRQEVRRIKAAEKAEKERLAAEKKAEQQRLEIERREAARVAVEKRKEAERQQEKWDAKLESMGLRKPARSMFEPLSKEWEGKLAQHMQNPRTRVKTPQPEPVDMGLGDFKKLATPDVWLNDTGIQGVLFSLAERINNLAGVTLKKDTPKCVVLNSYFYTSLMKDGVLNRGRMLKRVWGMTPENFFDVDTILIPINMNNSHWTLFVLRPSRREYSYIDSFHAAGEAQTAKVFQFLDNFLNSAWKPDEWKQANFRVPKQTNAVDCGMFVITNSIFIALGLDPSCYTQGDMPIQRRRMAAMLLNGGFKGEFDITYL